MFSLFLGLVRGGAPRDLPSLLSRAEQLAKEPNSSKYNVNEVFEAFKKMFEVSTLQEVCSSLSGLEHSAWIQQNTFVVGSGLPQIQTLGERVFLRILHVLLPELPTLNLTNTKKFRTLEDIKIHLDALITSGLAEDEAEKLRGVIYIMGQSESGKTSFVKTFTRFIENPTDQPKAMLTQENVDMHTQILETSDVNVFNKRKLSVNLKQIGGFDNTSKLISFSKSNLLEVDGSKEDRLALKLVDYGGHEVKTFLFNI